MSLLMPKEEDPSDETAGVVNSAIRDISNIKVRPWNFLGVIKKLVDLCAQLTNFIGQSLMNEHSISNTLEMHQATQVIYEQKLSSAWKKIYELGEECSNLREEVERLKNRLEGASE